MSAGRTAWAVLIGLIGGTAFTGAPVRPDLLETAVSISQQGATLRVTDVVSNRGGTAAPPSRTGYYLARIQIGGRPVGKMAPGALARGSRTLTIPGSVKRGAWRLFVCADAGNRIRETDERNNCRAASPPVEVGDRTRPTFAGLERATTCIPGPIGDRVRLSHYYLQWDPAADDLTPAREIVYDVYEAHTQGDEDFSTPTYTTPAGATSFTTPLLPDDTPHYFVVRARDKAGNHDANRVERVGMNLCV